MSDILELLSRRHTVRRVSRQPIPAGLVDGLLKAACLAPSAHNRQPWRFVVVESAAASRALALAMGQAFTRDLLRDGLSPSEARTRAEDSIQRLTTAPVLIVACLDPTDLDLYPDAERQAAEHLMGQQSVAAALQNLLLAAAEAGLGAGWMCAPLFCQDLVRATLDLPDAWEAQALITLGWPAEALPPLPRRPLDTLVVHR